MTGSHQETAALQHALSAEHAVIWGYGVVGAHLRGAALTQARTDERVHRDRRDSLRATLRARDVVPVAAAATYQLPFAVAGAASALRLAVHLEDGDAAAWAAVLAATAPRSPLRRRALASLVDAADRATRWRQRQAPYGHVTVALPGQPRA